MQGKDFRLMAKLRRRRLESRGKLPGCEHGCDELTKICGIFGIHGWVAALDDLAREAVQGLCIERVVQGRHFVEYTAEGPDVALVIVRLVLEYFRAPAVFNDSKERNQASRTVTVPMSA